MSTLMLDKKKTPAIMIVSRIRGENVDQPDATMQSKREKMDHVKLAAYELADKAGWHISDMEAFISCFRMLHDYLHEESENTMGDY